MIAALDTAEMANVLAAAALVFTVLTFFAGQRITAFIDPNQRDEPLDAGQGTQVIIDIALTVASGFVAVVLLPVLKDGHALSSLASADVALDNLFLIVWCGFVVVALLTFWFAYYRLAMGVELNTKPTDGATDAHGKGWVVWVGVPVLVSLVVVLALVRF